LTPPGREKTVSGWKLIKHTGKAMGEGRRFERVPCNEKVMVRYDDMYMGGRLRNISDNGALVQLDNELPMKLGTECMISICLNIFDITLHFKAEVRHSLKDEAGVAFRFMDSDSKRYLKSLLAFRIENPHLISEAFNYPPCGVGDSGD
jgi:hypothetical protein